ncbi:hypothetical protein Tco_0338525, partial [Tanacetum coccineum]
VDSSMHRSDPESEHSEQSTDDITKQDEGNDSDMENTDNAHIPKVSTTTWFKPIPEILSRFLKAKDQPHLNQNGPFPRMISQNQRLTGQIHTPQRIKFLRRTRFKGRRMILGHS